MFSSISMLVRSQGIGQLMHKDLHLGSGGEGPMCYAVVLGIMYYGLYYFASVCPRFIMTSI